MLIILFFGNYFWFPETFLAFWLVSSLEDNSNNNSRFGNRKTRLLFGSTIIVFVFSNIFHFNSLHPKNWAKKMETGYGYGLWYKEKDLNGGVFYWTKKKSRIYIYLNKNGRSENIRLVCGAPLGKLKEKEQRVDVYWKGKFYKKVIFKDNRDFVFIIKDALGREGFLEMVVYPTFNLEKLGLAEETRDLGVHLYFPFN